MEREREPGPSLSGLLGSQSLVAGTLAFFERQ